MSLIGLWFCGKNGSNLCATHGVGVGGEGGGG